MVPDSNAPPFRVGSGLDPASEASAARLMPLVRRGRTPAMGEENWVAAEPSSSGQYATGFPEGIRRRSVESRGFLPWLRRRRMPAASMGVHASASDRDHFGGHSGISPLKRITRSLIAALPSMVHVRPVLSVNEVVPGVWAAKSASATRVPPMPLYRRML